MPFSPIRITPGMDMGNLASSVNDAFNQIESENLTKVIKDEDGINRIILGQFPDGTYGFAISQKNVDVLELLEEPEE